MKKEKLHAFPGFMLLLFCAIQTIPATAGAATIAYGQSITIAINSVGERIPLNFDASTDDPVIVRVGDGDAWNYLDGRVDIYDPNGLLVASASSDRMAIAKFVVTNAGPHTIIVSDAGNDRTGLVGLSLQRARDPGMAGDLVYGVSTNVAIPSAVGIKTFKFMAQPDDPVIVRVGDGDAWNYLDGRVDIYDPNGLLVASASSDRMAIAKFVVTNAGPHTIIVSDDGGDTAGIVGLSLQRARDPGMAGNFVYGASTNVAIPSAVGIKTFKFMAQPGDPVIVRVGDGDAWNYLDGRVDIYDPNGLLVASASSDRMAIAKFVVTNAGPHTIIVSDDGGDTTGILLLELFLSEERVPTVFSFSASTNLLQRHGGIVRFRLSARDLDGVTAVTLNVQGLAEPQVSKGMSLTTGDARLGFWETTYSFPVNLSSNTTRYTVSASVSNSIGAITNSASTGIEVLDFEFDKLKIQKAGKIEWTAMAGRHYQLFAVDAFGHNLPYGPIIRADFSGRMTRYLHDVDWHSCAVYEVPDPSIGTFKLVSDACASFFTNGVRFYAECGYQLGHGRGFNFAVFDKETLELIETRAFDTWYYYSAWKDMADYVDSIPQGRVVLVATGDDIGFYAYGLQPNLEDGFRALEGIGSRQVRHFYFRDSWALVSIKGSTNALAESFQRGYGLTLEWRFAPPLYEVVNYELKPAAKLSWHSLTGRKYYVLESNDLISWSKITTSLPGTGELMTSLSDLSETNSVPRFFRLEIHD